MMKVLITGGAGFIGSHIAEQLRDRAEVRVIDNLRTGFAENLRGLRVRFFEGSILDRDLVASAVEGVDTVFHLAALVSVPESMSRPSECIRINTLGLLTVLEEAARAGVRKLCFSSSAAIYGDNPTVPKVETMIPEPKSPYAITKLDGEHYCDLFQREGRLQTVSLRYFNVFGPRQDPHGPYAAAVPIFIERALRHEPIVIFGDGGQSRDFIFVKDIVAANLHAAQHSTLSGVYNVAGGSSITIRELAEQIIRLTRSRSVIQHQPLRSGDVRHSLAATEKLAATGFRKTVDFAEALRQTIEHFRVQAAHPVSAA